MDISAAPHVEIVDDSESEQENASEDGEGVIPPGSKPSLNRDDVCLWAKGRSESEVVLKFRPQEASVAEHISMLLESGDGVVFHSAVQQLTTLVSSRLEEAANVGRKALQNELRTLRCNTNADVSKITE
eukprot:scpid54975/ scgid12664/ 